MTRQRLHLEPETCGCGLTVLATELDATCGHEWTRIKLAPVLITPDVQATARANHIRLWTIHADRYGRLTAGSIMPDLHPRLIAAGINTQTRNHGERLGIAPTHVHRFDPPGEPIPITRKTATPARHLADLESAVTRHPEHADLLRAVFDPPCF